MISSGSLLGRVIDHANRIGKESEEIGTQTLGSMLMQRKILEEGEQEVSHELSRLLMVDL